MKKLSMNNQGFSVVEAILGLIVLAALAFGGWWVWQKNADSGVSQNEDSSELGTESEDIIKTNNWQKYSDEVIAFMYPEDWSDITEPADENSAGEITAAVLVSPEQAESHQSFIDDGTQACCSFKYDITVSYHESDDAFHPFKVRGATSLSDYLTNTSLDAKDVKETSVNGHSIYEFILEGQSTSYILMLESNDGRLYSFVFGPYEGKSALSSEITTIVDSIQVVD